MPAPTLGQQQRMVLDRFVVRHLALVRSIAHRVSRRAPHFDALTRTCLRLVGTAA